MVAASVEPERTCVGCRARRPQRDLLRVVRGPGGVLAVGRTLPGRGAWLCASRATCRDLAVKRGAFGRALRGPVHDLGAVAALHQGASG